jgi:acetyl-CoA acetyltransferase
VKKVVVAGHVRSPFTHSKKGAPVAVRPDDLAPQVVGALVARAGIPPEDIQDSLLGCAFPRASGSWSGGRKRWRASSTSCRPASRCAANVVPPEKVADFLERVINQR